MTPLNVLISCEYSGTVRDAFLAQGHNAMSCDLLDTDSPGPHHKGDVLEILGQPWDLMIAHPPCTHLAVSGARHFAAKRADGRQQAGINFFMALVNGSAHIPKTVFEQPISIMSSIWCKPTQIIQPWMFGHPEQKSTCLWLKGLPPLVPTNDVRSEMMNLPKAERERIHRMPPSADRWKLRSTTFSGIAQAMAQQWGRQ